MTKKAKQSKKNTSIHQKLPDFLVTVVVRLAAVLQRLSHEGPLAQPRSAAPLARPHVGLVLVVVRVGVERRDASVFGRGFALGVLAGLAAGGEAEQLRAEDQDVASDDDDYSDDVLRGEACEGGRSVTLEVGGPGLEQGEGVVERGRERHGCG
jgi:hypothetical protein